MKTFAMRWRLVTQLASLFIVSMPLSGQMTSSPMLAWDEEPTSTVTGYAVTIDGLRVDYYLTPLNANLTCGCSIPLSFSGGRHTIVVSAYNASGETQSEPLEIAPVANAGGPYTGLAGTPLTVNGGSSITQTGSITTYAWSWGDSTSTTGSPAQAEHTYASGGTYAIALTITDNAGAVSSATTSATISPSPTNSPPTVALSSPTNNSTFTAPATISLAASATDSGGAVARVDFYAGPTLIGTSTAAPFVATWTNVSQGTYPLTALATDNGGARTTSAAVTVTVTGADATPPTISVVSPASGATVSGSVTVSANAADNVGVASVQFSVDGAALGAAATSAPYHVAWDTTRVSNGMHTVAAVARDAAGNTSTNAAATVNVSNVTVLVAFVQSATATRDGARTTVTRAFAASNTGGNLIAAAVSWATGTAPTCSDSQGNAYAVATVRYDAKTKRSLAICYAANIRGGANTVKVRFGASSGYRRLLIHEYTGLALANPVDTVANNLAAGSTTPDAVTSGMATTTSSGDLVFGVVMDVAASNTISAGTGFTRRAATSQQMESEDRVQVVSGPVAATQTFSRADRYLAQMVAFKHR